MEAKDLIGNTLIKKITNSKGTTWKPVLRQRWIGKFKGLKDYNRASLKDNYLIVEVGGYFDGPVFNPDPFIVVAGERIYLNYENSIPGPCLSPIVADQSLNSATYHHLGRPLPYQLVNTPRVHPKAIAKPPFT